jgi:hypothetical protein
MSIPRIYIGQRFKSAQTSCIRAIKNIDPAWVTLKHSAGLGNTFTRDSFKELIEEGELTLMDEIECSSCDKITSNYVIHVGHAVCSSACARAVFREPESDDFIDIKIEPSLTLHIGQRFAKKDSSHIRTITFVDNDRVNIKWLDGAGVGYNRKHFEELVSESSFVLQNTFECSNCEQLSDSPPQTFDNHAVCSDFCSRAIEREIIGEPSPPVEVKPLSIFELINIELDNVFEIVNESDSPNEGQVCIEFGFNHFYRVEIKSLENCVAFGILFADGDLEALEAVAATFDNRISESTYHLTPDNFYDQCKRNIPHHLKRAKDLKLCMDAILERLRKFNEEHDQEKQAEIKKEFLSHF